MNNDMRNEMLNKTYAATTPGYHEAFWKAMRGSNLTYGEMAQAKISANGGTYLLPAKTASRYSAALKNTNLFLRIGTVISPSTTCCGCTSLWTSSIAQMACGS